MTTLNAQQLEAVNCMDSHILCLSGAGTGKTHTMLSRILRLVNDGVPASSILALTFTNAAALEMRTRCNNFINTGSITPMFTTFHAFCYRILLDNIDICRYLGYADVPTILVDEDLHKLKLQLKASLGIKLSESKLDADAKRTPKENLDYLIYAKALDSHLKSKGYITFDVLAGKVCDMFIQEHVLIQKYKHMYTHVFVDEFQDTDPLQWKFVQSFTRANIFLVGDVLQCIYQFRGADDSIIKSICTDNNWTILRLGYNYRSTQEICDFANNMSVYANKAYRVELNSDNRGAQVDTRIMHYNTLSDILDIASYIKDMSGNTAILCRTNKEVREVVDTLNKEGISVATKNIEEDIVNIIDSLLNKVDIVDVACTKLTSTEYVSFLRLVHILDFDATNVLKTYFDNKTSKIFTQYNNILDILNMSISALDKFRNILNVLGRQCPKNMQELNTNEDVLYALKQLYEYSSTKNIYVGTIHSAKGLEYDNVILYNVGSKQFPLNNVDNLNLYYVGITRAKNNLIVYRAYEA